MNWLVPSVIATTAGTAILTICFYYISLQDSKRYLKIWAFSWGVCFIRYIFMLLYLLFNKNAVFLIGNQISGLISGILLLYGSYLFINKKFPKILWILTVLNIFWITISIQGKFSFLLVSLPTFSFLSFVYIKTGYIFIKQYKYEKNEAAIVGFSFIFWGIHKANYPFLRPVVWFVPWGYLIAAMLEFLTAFGLLLVYFRKTKNELLYNQKRLLSAQKIAKTGDWSWKLNSNELIWSDETYRIFGYEPGQFIVTVELFEKSIHPDDLDIFIKERDNAIIENRDVNIEHRIVLPDNSIRWVHEISSTVKDENDVVIEVSGTVQDITERKSYEDKLKLSQEKFIQYFNTNPSSTFVWQKKEDDFELLDVNNSAENITRGKAKDFIGLKAGEIYKDLPVIIEKMKECFSERSVIEFEHYYKNRFEGGYDWINFRFAFSKPDRILLFADLINEKKNAEKNLLESEKKWRSILVNTPQIGISLNPDAEIVFANDHFLKLTGWKRDEVLGKNWFKMFIPNDIRKEVEEVFEKNIKKKYEIPFSSFENTILTKSGNLLEVAWSNVVSKDSFGNIVDVTSLGIDLTERKKAEHELYQQKHLFETMFNTIPDGVVITDTERRVILANKGMKDTFGYEPEQLKGKKTQFLYASEDNFSKTGAEVFGKEAGKSKELYITQYLHKNGREFSGETFGTKLFNEENEWIGNLGIMRDITNRLETEKRLQQAQKMESMGSLAGGIAHDFNNILFPIIGLSELSLEDLEPGSLLYENVYEIFKAGRRAKDLVSQILAFSRQSEREMMPVRVQKVLKEVLKLCRSSIPTNIEIIENVKNDCGMVWADSTQLHQVGMNLITNAYHAVQEINGRIKVELNEVFIEIDDFETSSVENTGRYVLLSIADNGIGMSEEVKSKIFDPYFTTKEKGKGTGLGLAVVYGIVKEFGGVIKVDSELGNGTVFKIYLPVMKDKNEDEFSVLKDDIQTGTERILLVDDEPAIAKLYQLMLERLGYKVTTRMSSANALETILKCPNDFDLVISDMSMPGMTGDQLAYEIKKIKPEMPFIICTGFSERINEDRAKKIGINAFVMKPVERVKLAKIIREILD